jgi:uncharacterized protein
MRLPRPLDEIEVRVLGCLLEKQQTTPEYYPLTVNALLAACNQKSNREPVLELTEGQVRAALQSLRNEVLVWPVEGARAERWEHNLDRAWELDEAARAVITVLLLRGPQTPGEIRGRTDRMHAFPTPALVETTLHTLASGPEPLVVELARHPGHKENRWMHLACGAPDLPAAPARELGHAVAHTEGLADRVARLEAEIARLSGDLAALADLVGRRE